MSAASGITLFIDPFTSHFLGDRLFDTASGALGGDDIQGPWVALRQWFTERGVRVFTADRLLQGEQKSRHNVYVSLGIEDNAKALSAEPDVAMSALFLFEGPIVEPTLYSDLAAVQDCFRRIYSFSDEKALAPFLKRPVELRPFCIPSPVEGTDESVWHSRDRKFLVMINGNRRPRVYLDELYTERLRALEFFGARGEIDLYGFGWDHPPFRSGKTRMPYTLSRIVRKGAAIKQRARPDPLLAAARRVYLGPTDAKIATLGRYRFAICYENQVLKGWITEKIFDCFRAGTVPVYWGEPEIEKHIPPACYVDRRLFKSYDDLGEFLRSLGPDQIESFRQAARDFLGSEAFYPFSKQAFIDLCAGLVEEDTGVSLT